MMNCLQFCFNFAFKFNLRRYTEAQVGGPIGLLANGDINEVGRCMLTR